MSFKPPREWTFQVDTVWGSPTFYPEFPVQNLSSETITLTVLVQSPQETNVYKKHILAALDAAGKEIDDQKKTNTSRKVYRQNYPEDKYAETESDPTDKGRDY